MLSKKAERFLVELRLYLIRNGKSDREIDRITKELEAHLIEAEQNGKNIHKVIGKNPRQYMKSIGEEMPMDKKGLLTLIPMTILLILAFLSFSPALEGEFTLSKNILLYGSLMVVLSLLVYTLFLFKIVPQTFQKDAYLYTAFGLISAIVIGGWVLFLLWMKKQPDTILFTATSMENYLIAGVCVLIFIAFAIYAKSWFIVIIAALMAIGPVGEKLIPEQINHNPVYIVIAAILCAILLICFFYFMNKKLKSTN
ncbi:MAG: NADH dehydrogenase subunit [Bacillus sp. (in: firmicutes)]